MVLILVARASVHPAAQDDSTIQQEGTAAIHSKQHTLRAEESATSCWMGESRLLSEGRWVEALPPSELRYGPAIVPAAGDQMTRIYREKNGAQCSGAAPTLSCFSTAQRYSWQPLLPRVLSQNRTRVVHHFVLRYDAPAAHISDLHAGRLHHLGHGAESMDDDGRQVQAAQISGGDQR